MSSGLREELLRIREERGKLTPAIVLAEARSPDSPLHSRFTWDDAEAAEEHRLYQARELIRLVRIVYRRPSGEVGRVRQFHSLHRPELATERVYEPLESILTDDLQTKILLRSMERDIQELRRRYEAVAEFREIVIRELGLEEPA